MEATLQLILKKLESLEQGQAAMRVDINQMHINMDQMQNDIDQIKEDTAVTRDSVNSIGEWVEIASDVLKINYPVKK